MLSKQKIWNIQNYNKEKASCLAAELGISTIVTSVLLERGYDTVELIREFLYGSKEPFHDPFLMKDMLKAVSRIEQALADNEKITVYGDYDVDGMTASSLLYLYLKKLGANVDTYIPKRENEGYGLNDDALNHIHASGTGLVITVDCGISGLKEVEAAPAGMDIIITDHHTVPDILPPAYAIINPKQSDCAYPFKNLSGVGVAFKICQAFAKLKNGADFWWDDLTELAALGTIADIVPLIGENREIVRRGLKAMAVTKLIGLEALIKISGCQKEHITSENIGFMLAPRLNAVGRLEHAQSAVELLVSDDEAAAMEIAEKLNYENSVRQDISRKIMEEAELLLSMEDHIDTAIILASENWHQGVIGIVASRLVEKYHLPVILMSISGGVAKGSCRGIPALNLYEAIKAESDILTQFGGHHQAAGLTLPAEKVAEFKRRFRAYVQEHLQEEDYYPSLNVDCVLSDMGLITVRDLEELALLEPFGCCNPAPVFAFNNALLYNYKLIGKDKSHLQFSVTKGEYDYKAVMWNKADMLPMLYDNMVANIAYMPKINVWNGETSVQFHALSIQQESFVLDYRQQRLDKDKLTESFLRTNNNAVIYVNDLKHIPEHLRSEYVKFQEYGDFISSNIAVLYDIPQVSLKRIVKKLKIRNVQQIILAFNIADRESFEQELLFTYPDRNMLAVAYRKVMEQLKLHGIISCKKLLADCPELISSNSLEIMQELGFIVKNADELSIGQIKKRQLEDSSLFCQLQTEKDKLYSLLKENFRLSQYELMRNDK